MIKKSPHRKKRRSNRKKTGLRVGTVPGLRVTILYEDHDLLVVEKPPKLLTIATNKEKFKTAYAFLRDYLTNKPRREHLFIVHRLDRDASGLLVFAKNEKAKFALQAQFQDHEAGRIYFAVVKSPVREDQFTLRSLLAQNKAFRCYSTHDKAVGKAAVTHVSVLKRSVAYTLLQIKLETGKKHQIRVHLADQKIPIVGDKMYGSKINPASRMALHGGQLTFRHPHTGKEMTFTSELPSSLAKLV